MTGLLFGLGNMLQVAGHRFGLIRSLSALKSVTPPPPPPLWARLLPTKKWREAAAKKARPAVAVLDLHGVIRASEGGFGRKKTLSIKSTRKLIEQAFATPKLEAVFLSVNSPGGSPAQSGLICDYIQLLAARKKVKVLSFVEDCALSGGYWLACTGDKIFATESSVVGSIGAVSATFGFPEAMKYLNIERRVITAGRRKVLMDPFMPLKKEETARVQKLIDDIHTIFINHVKKQRGNRIAQFEDDVLFQGDIWLGREAVELGLVDGVDTAEAFVEKEYGPDAVNFVHIASKPFNLKEMFSSSSSLAAAAAARPSFDGEHSMPLELLQHHPIHLGHKT